MNELKQICKYLLEILEEIFNKKIKIKSTDFNQFLRLKKLEEENDYNLFFSNTYFDDLLHKYKVDMNYIRKGVEAIKNYGNNLYINTESNEPTELFIIDIKPNISGGDEISFKFQNRQLFFDTLENIQPYNLIEVFGPGFDEATLDQLLASNDNEFVKWVNSQYNTTFEPYLSKYPTSASTLKEKIDILLRREHDIVD